MLIDKSKILYKGDMLAALFYIFIGVIFLIFAVGLYYFTESVGFRYLSIGFFMFFMYSTGKGLFIYTVAKKRFDFYKNQEELNTTQLREEIKYSDLRIQKKHVSRRIYIYSVVIFSFLAFISVFTPFKSIVIGTSIPIALVSAIEFSIGLMTEFRLREYHRILEKTLHS